jgi:predicted metal-dependent hydrolase
MIARLRLRDIFRGKGPDADRPREDGQLRRIALAGEQVDYRLVRARRRTIGMQIGLSGLTVARAALGADPRDRGGARRARCMGGPLASRMAGTTPRRASRAWETGASILYLGRELALAVHPARKKEIAADLINLSVLHPAADDERQVAAFVGRWLRDEALRLLEPRVADFAARVTTRVPTLKLSNSRSEWGSCNQHGVIRLNWRLVQLPPHLAYYVVAHEVAHLVELNHSQRFWGLVEMLLSQSLRGAPGTRRLDRVARGVSERPRPPRARPRAFPDTIAPMRNKDFGTRLRGAVCTAATVAAAAILIAGCGCQRSAQAAACRSRRHAITQRAAGAAAGSDACRATRHIASTGRPAQAVIAFSLSRGELHAERVSLATIAERFGTPCYVYSRAALEASYDTFDAAFAGIPHLVCYAMKANSNLAILNLLARRGSGFDIVSGGELERVIAAGGEATKTVFSGVGKSALEMEAALAAGIRCFNVESAAELEV